MSYYNNSNQNNYLREIRDLMNQQAEDLTDEKALCLIEDYIFRSVYTARIERGARPF